MMDVITWYWLSMLGLDLTHASKRGSISHDLIAIIATKRKTIIVTVPIGGDKMFGKTIQILPFPEFRSTPNNTGLYTAGHLHTAVPHCSHSRAPGEQWARLWVCVFTLQGCVQAARLCRGPPVNNTTVPHCHGHVIQLNEVDFGMMTIM